MALSSLLGQIILLKKKLSEAIRAIRSIRGLGYGDLADIGVQNSIGDLERARYSITIDKLTDPSKALQFDPIAMLSLCVSIQNDEFTEAVLEQARARLDSFKGQGGEDLFRSRFEGKELKKWSLDKPRNSKNAEGMRDLKASGLIQAEAAQRLGLAKSTVHRYWQQQTLDRFGNSEERSRT